MQTGAVRWQTRKVLTQRLGRSAALPPVPLPHWVRLGSALLAALTLMAASAQAATPCQIRQVIELPITMDSLRPTLPVKINNKDAKLVLDSGAAYSILSSATASNTV